MPVFASQFGRARPYAVAYAGPASESRFWIPATVTAASITAAALLAAAVDDAHSAGGDGGGGGFDPDGLDHAALELPGLSTGHHLVADHPPVYTDAHTANPSGAHAGAHTGSATGTDAAHTTGAHAGSAAGAGAGEAAGAHAGGADSAATHLDAAGATDQQAAMLDNDSAGVAWAHHSDLTHTAADGADASYLHTGDSGATIGHDGGGLF